MRGKEWLRQRPAHTKPVFSARYSHTFEPGNVLPESALLIARRRLAMHACSSSRRQNLWLAISSANCWLQPPKKIRTRHLSTPLSLSLSLSLFFFTPFLFFAKVNSLSRSLISRGINSLRIAQSEPAVCLSSTLPDLLFPLLVLDMEPLTNTPSLCPLLDNIIS